jgi:hypothetical protein
MKQLILVLVVASLAFGGESKAIAKAKANLKKADDLIASLKAGGNEELAPYTLALVDSATGQLVRVSVVVPDKEPRTATAMLSNK